MPQAGCKPALCLPPPPGVPQLDISMAQLEERVAELGLLLPDLVGKLDRLQVRRGEGAGRRLAAVSAAHAQLRDAAASRARRPRE